MENGKINEFVRFCLVGGLGIPFEFCLLYIFKEYLGLHYLYSSGIAFTLSVLLNYYLCVRYVFSSTKVMSFNQTAAFMVTSIIGLIINQTVMWLLVELFGIYYMAAKIVAMVIVTVWNYFTKRYAIKRL